MPSPTYDLIASHTVTTAGVTKITFSGFSTSYRHITVIASNADGNSGVDAFSNEASLWWTHDTQQTTQRYNDMSTQGWNLNIPSPTYTWYLFSGHSGGYCSRGTDTPSFGVRYILVPRYNDSVEHGVFQDGNQMIYPDTITQYSRSIQSLTNNTSPITSFEIGTQNEIKIGSTYFVYGLKSA